MSYKNWIFERDGKIGIIKMNRPEVRNALNWETWMELEDILKRLVHKNQSREFPRILIPKTLSLVYARCELSEEIGQWGRLKSQGET